MKPETHISTSTGVDNDIQFSDIFELDEIQKIQDLFSDATGVASIITHPDGIPITNPSNFRRLCIDIIRKTEKGCANCYKSDEILGRPNASGPIVQPCLSGGLWDAGASITVGGKHIANWLIGQVRNDKLDEQRMVDYADEIGADKTEFMSALSEVPVMSSERFQKVAEMLYVFANELSEKTYKNLDLKKHIEESERLNEQLHKSEESLSITLNSIGDGVISTDNKGLIVSMNPVAESLCGWSLTEALGKSLTEVFNIVNSETRQIVENPVEKVLETGKIVGLANHTVLISKNGTEYHIADSAAPIMNSDGVCIGVVLVFSDITEKYLAEEKIRENERSKSVLLSNLPGMAFRSRFDRQWTMEFVSEGFFDLTGYSTEEIINNKSVSFNDLILPEYRDHLWKTWENAVLEHQNVCEEYKILTSGGQIKWVWEQGTPIFNKAGEVEALEGLIIDINDRKQAEEKLQNERLLLRSIIDNIPDLIYTKDLNSRKTLANLAEVEMLGGKSEAEVLGKDDFDHYPKELAEKYYAADRLVFQTGRQIINKERSIADKNGNIKWMLFSKLLLRDKDNQVIGLLGIGHDITDQKIAEDKLQNERLLLRTVIDNIPGTIYAKDLAGRKTLANKAEVDFVGAKSEAEVLGKDDFDFYPKEIAEKFLVDDQLMIQTGVPEINKESSEFDGNGIKHWLLSSKLPLRDKNNQIIGLVGITHDITYRKVMEEAWRESEIFLKETQMIAMLGNCMVDIKSGKWQSSEILDRILGIDADFDKAIKSILIIIHPEWKKQVLDYFRTEVAANNTNFNKKFKIIRQNDKDVRWVHAIGELKYDNNQLVKMVVTIQDITERKQTAEALRASETLYRSVLNASPDIIAIVDLDGVIRMVSPAALNIYGCESMDEILGRNLLEFLAPEEGERVQFNFSRMFNGFVGTAEYRMILADGSISFAEINGDAIRNVDGQPSGFVFIIRNIDERKRVEAALSNSQEQLKKFAAHLQNVREEERVSLAREIHDELGQILIAIKIDVGILKQNVLKMLGSTAANDILIKFEQLFNLVDNTINTTRRIMTNLRPEVLYLLGFIESAKLQTSNFQRRHNVNCNFECSIDKLEVNSQQSVALYRILQEALTNVAKHSKATSVIVKLYFQEDKLILEINDNGVGFDEVTKIKNDSYGLIGMKERVFLLDGELSVSGRDGNGTNIKVEIPYFK